MNAAPSHESNFEILSLNRGGLKLFTPENAIKVVNNCEKNNKIILGIDGFIINDESTIPCMEHSIDLSNQSSIKFSVNAARDFLTKYVGQDLMFEIVV